MRCWSNLISFVVYWGSCAFSLDPINTGRRWRSATYLLSLIPPPPPLTRTHLNHHHHPLSHTTMSGKGKAGKSGGKAAGGDSTSKSQSRSAKAGLQFPVGRVHRLLKKGNYAQRVGAGAPGLWLAFSFIWPAYLSCHSLPRCRSRVPCRRNSGACWECGT